MNLLTKLEGVERALGRFEEIKQKSHRGQLRAIEKVAILLRDSAVRYVGAGHPEHPDVQTGRLRASIRYAVQDGTPVTAAVGTDAEYASYVEFGHSQAAGRFVPAIGKQLVAGSVKPYPFMRPAMDEVVAGGHAARV